MLDRAAKCAAIPVGVLLLTAAAVLAQEPLRPLPNQGQPLPGPAPVVDVPEQAAPAVKTQPSDQPAVVVDGVAPDASWLEPLIQRLDSDNLAERERATGDLQTDARLSLALLQTRIADRSRPLTPEQSLRLSEVALRLFRESPRAAMGVSFTQRPVAGGVEIGMAIEQFDARRVLKAGDVIAEMDGVPIVSYDDARAAIISHDPGEEMQVTFLRAGEVQHGVIRLGSYKDLENTTALTDTVLREAWMVRCERLAAQGRAGVVNAPVEAGLSPEQWVTARLAERRAQSRRQQQDGVVEAADAGTPALVGGGSMRRAQDVLIDFSDADQRRQSPQARNLQNQIENLQVQAKLFEQQLRTARLNEVQRESIQRTLQWHRDRIRQLKAERVRLLREEAAGR